MMPIREFLDSHKFDPETRRVLGLAFEITRAALQLEGNNAPANEALAKRIIALALLGERDPERISELVLVDLRSPPGH
jgi:hypothetical protein